MTSLPAAKAFDVIFNELSKYSVGFEPTFRVLEQMKNSQIPNYPPYNLEQLSETTLRLSIALAGFKKEDIEIILQEKKLTITGNKTASDKARKFIVKGIAERSFTRAFILHQTMNITRAKFEDGVLEIDFEQIIPESQKPKKIDIQSVK
jgi:molecular chaperone IbpA